MYSSFKNPLTLVPVSLGKEKMFVPVAEIPGKSPGKTLLITAGMDGDEYESIEAAYALIEKYKTRAFAGRLVIIPIVNMYGFEARCAENPLDNLFPKHLYPGRRNGTPSERLLHWLSTSYVRDTQAWIDMHSGSVSESLVPFAWLYKTGIEAVDTQAQAWYIESGAQYIVFQKAERGWRANLLAQHSCLYFETEAGERSSLKKEHIEQHIAWVELLMQQLGMLPTTPSATKHTQTIFDGVRKVIATHNGLFYPVHSATQTINKGDTLGSLRTYDLRKIDTVTSPIQGTILWQRDTPMVRKGDTLCGIGYKNA